MSVRKTFTSLAVDLGAESGRVILGGFDGARMQISDVHRFPNRPVSLPDGLHWNLLGLWQEILTGIQIGLSNSPAPISSIGVDTWGVDYGLLDCQKNLLGTPFHYRDERTNGLVEAACSVTGRDFIYEHTGIQFLQLNTLYQLYAMVLSKSPILELAHHFVTIPDLINYWLSGTIANEYTIVTTTQCFDIRRNFWSIPLLEKLSIPASIFGEIIQPGTILGGLCAVGPEGPFPKTIQVIAPASHDTGSAVAAVPSQEENFAWISSGTWSIMGIETKSPVVTPDSLRLGVTNEGGVNNTIRLSKNIMGLWPIQECRRTWASEGKVMDYGEITSLAAQAPELISIIDVDDGLFLPPGDMPARIRSYCQAHQIPLPETCGSMARCILESVALKYRSTLDALEHLQGKAVRHVHIVGGGTQNELLSQFAADAMNRPVISGPVEATALGNLLVQAIAAGEISNLDQARAVVSSSFEVKTFLPRSNRDRWEEAYQKLRALQS